MCYDLPTLDLRFNALNNFRGGARDEVPELPD